MGTFAERVLGPQKADKFGAVTIHITGDKELDAMFRKLPLKPARDIYNAASKDVVKNMLRPAVRAAIAAIGAGKQRKGRGRKKKYGTAKLGRLAQGMRFKQVPKRVGSGYVLILPKRGKLDIDEDAKFYWPVHLELGHKKRGGGTVQARPFMRGPFDRLREKMFRRIRRRSFVALEREARKIKA